MEKSELLNIGDGNTHRSRTSLTYSSVQASAALEPKRVESIDL